MTIRTPRTPTRAITLYEIELLHQAIHDYEQREHWRTIKQWVEQCYAPGTVETVQVQSHDVWEKGDEHYTRITVVVAYDETGEIVPADLIRPFFHLPELSQALTTYLTHLPEGEVLAQEDLYEIVYCAGCLCKYKDWVCTCALPGEARTYDLQVGEPPFPWQISIQRTDGSVGEDPPSPL